MHRIAEVFLERGVDLISGGTDNHLLLLDLTNLDITGKDAEDLLGRAGIRQTRPGSLPIC